LLPNPISIVLKDTSNKDSVSKARVTVELVDGTGISLPDDEQEYLDSSSGSLTQMANKDCECRFSLKVLQNSKPSKFRLKFIVDYSYTNTNTSSEESRSEVIYSNPFSVRYISLSGGSKLK
jgi:hypothetical protein